MATYHIPVEPFQPVEPFKSGRTLARVVIILLIASMILDVVGIFSTLSQISLLNKVAGGYAITESEAMENDSRQLTIARLQLLVYLITAICFLVWIHRTYKNLKPLGTQNPDYSPGWAVGYFFIPFINLVRPHQVVQEIWRESNPETVAALSPYERQAFTYASGSRNAALVTFWWVAYLLMNVMAYFAARLGTDAKSLNDFAGASWISIVSDSISIVAAILAILVVRKIDSMQEEKYRRLTTMAPRPAIPPADRQPL